MMFRVVVVAVIGVLGSWTGPSASASTSAVTPTFVGIASGSVPPESPSEIDETPAPAPETSDPPVPPPESSVPDQGTGEGTPTDTTEVDAEVVARPGAAPRVQSSDIPVGSIALAVLVLMVVGTVSLVAVRRRPARPATGPDQRSPNVAGTPLPSDGSAAVDSPRGRTAAGATTLEFLLGLGEALIDAGAASSHVESAVRTVAKVTGVGDVGVIVLPTALIVSIPDGQDVVTDISGAGRGPLRLDQVDDVLALVQDAESGAVDSRDGKRRLAAIRSSAPPYSKRLAVFGYACSTVGLAAILRATWVELVLAAVLGVMVGLFRLSTRRLGSSYQPFVPLIAATAVSVSVLTLDRVVGDLLTFPLIVAPLITFLPGALLTIAALELATGQIVSGTSRLASGGMQLVLLALGIVAGGELVGVPAYDLGSGNAGSVGVLTPWIGVAVFGIGIVWFNGARSAARAWILLVLYVAYAGQVIGGLFFGSALSAFFGALAMTPIAILAARQRSGPSPLVMFLPGFWLLVPGALGLDGVTRLLGAGGATTTGALVTTATSMVGISLGILLGLVLVAKDPDNPWAEARPVDHLRRASPISARRAGRPR